MKTNLNPFAWRQNTTGGLKALAVLLAAAILSTVAVGCGDDNTDNTQNPANNAQDDTANNAQDPDDQEPDDQEPDDQNPDVQEPDDREVPTSNDRADAPTYGVRGPHAVGFASVEVEREGAAPLEVDLWYPALNPDNAPEAVLYDMKLKAPEWAEQVESPMVVGRALQDATINDGAGPLPVILFSHGFGLNAAWYSDLIEHYASHGFVVLAPDHTESDWFQVAEASFDRPVDVTHTLDLAEALGGDGGQWDGLLDLERVALVGHSYGGYTALAAAGARFEWAPFEARCADLHPEDPAQFLCAPFVGRQQDMAQMAGLDEVPEGLWPSMRDERVKAIVPISGDAYLFGQQGLAQITVPMMAIGGTADFGTPWTWGPEPAYTHTSSQRRALMGLEGGSHFLPSNLCQDMPWVSQLSDVYAFACFDPVWDKSRALDLIQHFSTAFLLSTFTDDQDAAAALDPAFHWLPGVQYQAVLP